MRATEKQVWVYAENTVMAGHVVTSRREDFDSEPDSDDFISIDLELARLWEQLPVDASTAFQRRAAANTLEYLGEEAVGI